jgi:hypothetical protein
MICSNASHLFIGKYRSHWDIPFDFGMGLVRLELEWFGLGLGWAGLGWATDEIGLEMQVPGA